MPEYYAFTVHYVASSAPMTRFRGFIQAPFQATEVSEADWNAAVDAALAWLSDLYPYIHGSRSGLDGYRTQPLPDNLSWPVRGEVMGRSVHIEAPPPSKAPPPFISSTP